MGLSIGLSQILSARGQPAWPARPLRLLVPFPAGGNTDGIARLLAQRLGERLGQAVVVENQAGAAGAIAARAVAKAPPDGYTLFMAALPQIAVLPAAGVNSYDPVKDFAPICNVGSNPFVLMTPAKSEIRSLKDLIDAARARPGVLSYASAGIGSLAHLSAALLWNRAGVDILHVPYQGDAQAMSALLGAQVGCYFGNISVAIPQSKAGAVHALAISDDKRNPQMPDTPTVAELGYPGYRTITWNGVLAPAATPRDVVDRLARDIKAIIANEEFARALTNYGVDPSGEGPAEFANTIAADIRLWGDAVALAGVRLRE